MASELDDLALAFEADRTRLRGVAYRILGSASDADDAVQETWLRLSRSDVSDVVSLPAWLTTSDTSERLSRSHVSCTASSASLAEPSIR